MRWPACSAAAEIVRDPGAPPATSVARPIRYRTDGAGRFRPAASAGSRAGFLDQFRPGHRRHRAGAPAHRAASRVLSLAPSLLVMVTSFTRIVVVLSLLRSAIGAPTAPPNAVIVSLALFLTVFVMAPTFAQVYEHRASRRSLAGQIQPQQAFERGVGAVQDLHAAARPREGPGAVHGHVARAAAGDARSRRRCAMLVPAFMISELRRAFEIGFLLFVPVPDHRPRGRLDPDVDGHDDAAAGRRWRCRSS